MKNSKAIFLIMTGVTLFSIIAQKSFLTEMVNLASAYFILLELESK